MRAAGRRARPRCRSQDGRRADGSRSAPRARRWSCSFADAGRASAASRVAAARRCRATGPLPIPPPRPACRLPRGTRALTAAARRRTRRRPRRHRSSTLTTDADAATALGADWRMRVAGAAAGDERAARGRRAELPPPSCGRVGRRSRADVHRRAGDSTARRRAARHRLAAVAARTALRGPSASRSSQMPRLRRRRAAQQCAASLTRSMPGRATADSRRLLVPSQILNRFQCAPCLPRASYAR